MRNVEPESVDVARRVWERRSLTMFHDRARGCVRITIELPAEEGELVGRAIESAVAAGEVAHGVEFATDAGRAADGWRAQQADAIVAISKAYLGGGAGELSAEGDASSAHRSASNADHYQVVVHVDEKSLRGGIGRADLAIETIRRHLPSSACGRRRAGRMDA